jgi:hypothetical protein
MANSNCKKAEIVELIKVTVIEGTGNSKEDQIKEIAQYWSKDGELLFTMSQNEKA